MKEWLLSQIENFNVLMLIFMIVFVTILSKFNTQKMLKEQSQEIYNEVEEIKEEIWRANGKEKYK